MEDIIDIKDFFVTTKSLDSVAWRILPSIREMIRLLNDQLEVSRYGDDIDFLMFVFIILPKENQRHENYLCYSESDMILQYRIPYESISISSPRENLSCLAHHFLEAIHFYQEEQLNAFKTFDFRQFKMDAAALFEIEEWIVN
ncbi:MAG: hypothetical protein AAF806_24315 [Bacteroidota bacterium]